MNTASAPEKTQPEMVRLADYRPPAFSTQRVELRFQIFTDHTLVRSHVKYFRTEDGTADEFLVLDAQDPNPETGKFIQQIQRDGNELTGIACQGDPGNDPQSYYIDSNTDKIYIPMARGTDQVELIIDTYLEPQHNSALSGFYKSDRCFVTQCESEGFRRITPFLDRPDVMATYVVTIEAPEDLCPTLISNGNEVEKIQLGDGRHRARFEDPWPKPSYLFATANGQLDWIEDQFETMGGRIVRLRVYTDTSSAEKGWHAMDALKRAMKWDEQTFGCEYDLNDYGVVAVSRFSMGAMENKGLNVFRDSLVLASAQTATDDDYQNIIDVIGHEYFHNYSGNRITNRNWFNLSLKEGLTVNREQLFTAFTTSSAIERISAVQVLRRGQFPEDDGPNSHPVMPAEIRAIDNIYSATVYIKGSEVIRMMKVMMGEQKFIEGVKHYFSTYDGQAVTIAEFVSSMEAVSGLDLSGQFNLWYTQSGRPHVKARGQYDADSRTYRLFLSQHTEPTRDQAVKKAMLIPVQSALVSHNGKNITFRLAPESSKMEEGVLMLTEAEQSFTFYDVSEEPAFHSLLRGLSAPVDLDPGLTEEQLHRQLRSDTDGFNRWDAGQKLAIAEMERLYRYARESGSLPEVSRAFLESIASNIEADLEPNLKSVALSLPAISELEHRIKPVDPQILQRVTEQLRETLASALRSKWEELLKESLTNNGQAYEFNYTGTGLRRLKRLALQYLCESGNPGDLERARHIYEKADNMTDRTAVMSALANHAGTDRKAVYEDFFQRFKSDSLTIQKYFAYRASGRYNGVIQELEELLNSREFVWDIPGHVQSLFRGFIGNYAQFHRQDGAGYSFLARGIIREARVNGTTAAGMVGPLAKWKDYESRPGEMMLQQLKEIKANLDQGLASGEVKKVDALPILDRIDRALP
ncbi:MAG: aminopeptidase N [Leptospiraceae bacterium]